MKEEMMDIPVAVIERRKQTYLRRKCFAGITTFILKLSNINCLWIEKYSSSMAGLVLYK